MASPQRIERRRADKFQLRVWSRDGGKCIYCERPVKFGRQIPKLRRETHKSWLYQSRGQWITVLKASLHHLVDIVAGGKSTLSNLALTCINCNEGLANRHKENQHESEAASPQTGPA